MSTAAIVGPLVGAAKGPIMSPRIARTGSSLRSQVMTIMKITYHRRNRLGSNHQGALLQATGKWRTGPSNGPLCPEGAIADDPGVLSRGGTSHARPTPRPGARLAYPSCRRPTNLHHSGRRQVSDVRLLRPNGGARSAPFGPELSCRAAMKGPGRGMLSSRCC